MTKEAAGRRDRLESLSPPQHVGTPPGAIHKLVGSTRPVIHVIQYDAGNIEERYAEAPGGLAHFKNATPHAVTWINIDGLGDETLFKSLRDDFGLHALALEDVLNLAHRPKFESYDATSFIVLKMPTHSQEEGLELEQLSVFVMEGLVITLQEHPGDCLEQLRERIRGGKGRVRRSDTAYLAYAIVDSVVDAYFPVLDGYADRLEELEGEVIEGRANGVVSLIHEVRHDLRKLRQSIWPMREVATTMLRDADSNESDIRLFLRDTYDHAVRLLEGVDSYRELAAGLMELHLSNVSMRMNQTMKVLTIIATIFMPLGFITGLYGMNFNGERSPWNMPELQWTYGYPFALGLMFTTALGLFWFFRRLGWLSKDDTN